ncbi:hypothetical protein SADUNF_Sadunf19G0021500 [Salix dunnii]|uniref:Uncharacterized protein n=1 Tax=Salix dunnii TaxID=1413687 RepID=A0A835J1H6_9ROSI|nr:hypothetical protein SADUNF_Sadunf19G0021500 [Salix dunnii]
MKSHSPESWDASIISRYIFHHLIKLLSFKKISGDTAYLLIWSIEYCSNISRFSFADCFSTAFEVPSFNNLHEMRASSTFAQKQESSVRTPATSSFFLLFGELPCRPDECSFFLRLSLYTLHKIFPVISEKFFEPARAKWCNMDKVKQSRKSMANEIMNTARQMANRRSRNHENNHGYDIGRRCTRRVKKRLRRIQRNETLKAWKPWKDTESSTLCFKLERHSIKNHNHQSQRY